MNLMQIRRFLLSDVTAQVSDAVRSRITSLESLLVQARRKKEAAEMELADCRRDLMEVRWQLDREKVRADNLQRELNRLAGSLAGKQHQDWSTSLQATKPAPEPTSGKRAVFQGSKVVAVAPESLEMMKRFVAKGDGDPPGV
jgi:septal ring factor EnvC (AmiA/AmiB activator)